MSTPNIPSFVVPGAQGLLSNKRGSNTGADAISITSHYANPIQGANDKVGNIRVQVERTSRFGTQLQTPETVWDSGWTGTPSVQSIPTVASESTPVTATFGGRVYCLFLGNPVFGGSGNCWSAPLIAGGVGSWRPENGLGPSATWFPYATATTLYAAGATQLVAFGSALIACANTTVTTSTAHLFIAQIGANGVLGPWQDAGLAPYNLSYGAVFVGGSNGLVTGLTIAPGVLILAGGKNTAGTVVSTTSATWMNGDGTPFLWPPTAPPGVYGWYTTPQPTLPAARQNAVGYYQPNWGGSTLGAVYVIGGDDGTNASNAVYSATYNPSVYQGLLSSWSTITALPAVRTGHALAVTVGPDNLTYFWVLGGAATVGGAATTTIYETFISAAGTLAAWGTAAFSLPSTGLGITGWSGAAPISFNAFGLPSVIGNDPFGDKGGASGATLATAWIAYMYVASAVRAGNVHATSPAFVTGNAPGLTTTNLGGVGISSIVTNADSTMDIAFVYGGWGGAAIASLDGDQLQIIVQYVSVNGDASRSGSIALKIGQPPTIGSLSPASGGTPSNGQPPLSFAYNPGTGGSAQQWWQVQVKLAGVVIFDTGLRYDASNLVSPLTIAPLLTPSTAYTLVVTVNSLDSPVAGSSDQAVSTTAFTTTAFAVPSAPASLTAMGIGATASIALAWAAVGGASYYRVYYRRAGQATWWLYADNVAGTTLTAMDHIALGISYDFAVTAVSAVPAESAKTSTQTAAIQPNLGYAIYLHVAGNGTVFGLGFKLQGVPTVREYIDVGVIHGFGQGAPVTRYGVGDYRALTVPALLTDPTPAALKSLQAIMDQVKAGATCFYRDVQGGMLLTTFTAGAPGQTAITADQSLAIVPPTSRLVTLQLSEVGDLVGPYVPAGQAQGYPALIAGRKPPLDTSERLL